VPARDSGEHLSPPVAEIVEKVNARVASAATVSEIRALADQARTEARGSTLTMQQIGELFTVATDRAREVERLSARLADLLGESGDG
jgi:hypothetical protein